MAFAQLSDLEDRLDWELDDDDKRIGQAAIDDLSEEANDIGGKQWNEATVPKRVRKIVLAAAVRYMRNPDGLVQSRAGDETLIYNEDKTGQAGSAHFSTSEIEDLAGLASSVADFGTIDIQAYGGSATSTFRRRRFFDHPGASWRPGVYPGAGERDGRPFPLYAEDEAP